MLSKMGSHLLEILRQGVWASLTGGWFHDPRQPVFINTVHLYLWLFFMAFPLTLCIYFTSTPAIWSIYVGTVGIVFFGVKVLNTRFHYLFDTTEPIVEPEKEIGNVENNDNGQKTDRIGLNESEGIELQDLSTIQSSVARQINSSVDEQQFVSCIGDGTDLKVEVHRNESTSSSGSSVSSVSKDNVDAEKNNKIWTLETVVIHGHGPSKGVCILHSSNLCQNDVLDSSCSGMNNGIKNSNETSLNGRRTCDSDLRKNLKLSVNGVKLKESTSLELGGILSPQDDAVAKAPFRRSKSVLETSLCDCCVNHCHNSRKYCNCDNITESKSAVTLESTAISHKKLENGNDKVGSIDENKFVAVKSGFDSKSDSESEDEQTRSRTPLLARHCSLEQKSSNDKSVTEAIRKKSEGATHTKRVSFSTRSLDGSQHYYHQHQKGRSKQYDISKDRDNRVGKDKRRKLNLIRNRDGRLCRQMYQRSESAAEVGMNPLGPEQAISSVSTSLSADHVDESTLPQKRFALVPQNDSMVGWNLPGGPFSSQWMFQAVNAVKPAASSKQEDESDDEEACDTKLPSCDTDSIASADSQQSQSLVGLTWLFASNTDLSAHALDGDSLNSEDTPGDMSIPVSSPDEVRLGAIPKRSAFKSHSVGMGRRANNARRADRESSPRILERLLEESQEVSPSAFIGGNQAARTEIGLPNAPRKKGTGRNRRSTVAGDRGSPVPVPPFLHSVPRDLKLNLRSIGLQNSEMIGGQVHYPTSCPFSNSTQGLFRPKEETVHGDADSTTVSRHRRLMRLTNSRRSLDRRHGFGNVPGTGTHVANSHEDTSEGAMHYFQDEDGNWHSYTFSEKPQRGSSQVISSASMEKSSPSYLSAKESEKHSSEPQQSTSSNQIVSGAFSGLKTPSSSGSWSSESSTELAVDTSTNKMYASYRRNNAHHRSLPGPSHGQNRNYNQTDSGCPSPVASVPSLVTITPEYSSVSASASSHVLSTTRLPMPSYASMTRSWQRNRRDVLQVLTDSLTNMERRRMYNLSLNAEHSYFHSSDHGVIGSVGDRLNHRGNGFDRGNKQKLKKLPRQYYNMKLFFLPNTIVKIRFDRLKLMSLFDKNRSIFETLISIFLAVGVAFLGSFLLQKGYYQDLYVVLICFVMASCQFSLLKSVQPDPASPVHGYNRVVAFSRPIYFCLCGGLVYLIEICLNNNVYDLGLKIYNVDITQHLFFEMTRDALLIILLCFPLLFSVGLFPQINTFVMYLLEQIDMHVFGGNATSSLSASVTSLFRSFVAVGLLYGFAYGAMSEDKSTQHLMFSMFCGLLIIVSYHLSRCTSDTSVMWSVLKHFFCPEEDCFGPMPHATVKSQDNDDQGDPLPKKLKETVTARLKSDVIICTVVGFFIFGIHSSTVFSSLQPSLTPTLWILAIFLGFFLHYLIPQFRKQLPCLIASRPILPPAEYHQFEVHAAGKLMWFEKIFIWMCFFEKNIVYPLLFISALTEDSIILASTKKFGVALGSFIIVVAGLKAVRTSFSDPGKHYLILFFTLLFFTFDWSGYSETFIVDFFFMSIMFAKLFELWLKLQFVITYIAPWQITWGSAWHAFAQPFSVPHSAMLFLQAIVSSVLSAPLNPFLGSAIFITSYVRPIKFWEKDYNTKRVDHSNTRLSTHLEKNPGSDDNNLNSIFYEHLTRSLQDYLCGDLLLGRWGQVSQGDCFVLASDYLNCLVHIIEVGNGLTTFQMRGLEFRGTYCQQREVEAISEGVEDDDGFCCCEPGHPPRMLSVNSAFSQRWLAWEVIMSKYVIEGYSISDNNCQSMLQVYDLRKILITYYVKGIIYYAVNSPKLEEWLNSEHIMTALNPTNELHYVELDPMFSINIDEDYDFGIGGVTRKSFCKVYLSWIRYCLSKRETGEKIASGKDSSLVSLCFALSILGRRALGVAAHSNSLSNVEFFLYGLHALFKGDFRITSQRDEWVFCDMDLLKSVVSAAVRMSLKLHQDHFMCPDEYDDHAALYDAISYHEKNLVISHEGDPAWRNAVLSGTPALLALRHVLDDGNDEYKVIMLNKRHLGFRVIKLNRECVRGLWAGQQQELVYLRNRDPERGSIQNAKQALRNIINSSCDQPIGYPIYVSPLTTSFADTHPQLCSLVGGPISLSEIKKSISNVWRRIRLRVGEGCSSGSSIPQDDSAFGHDGVYSTAPTNLPPAVSGSLTLSGSQSLDGSQVGSSTGRGSINRGNFNRGSVASSASATYGKPSTSTLASLAGFLNDTNANSTRDKERDSTSKEKEVKEPNRDKENVTSIKQVKIIDANLVYDGLNLGRRIDVLWPDEAWRSAGGRSYWKNWVPIDGMEGVIVHKWVPCHRDPQCRSITDKTILLIKIEDKYVPIAEAGVEDVEQEA